VDKTGGAIALLYLLTLLVVYKVWLKRTSTKASKEGGLITFSFNFPFPLETIHCFPPSTCVSIKVAKVSMNEGSILSLEGICKVCYFSNS
jgi:pyruvate/2-oxoacid:ferredoxin oxidoreductase alpha subunit